MRFTPYCTRPQETSLRFLNAHKHRIIQQRFVRFQHLYIRIQIHSSKLLQRPQTHIVRHKSELPRLICLAYIQRSLCDVEITLVPPHILSVRHMLLPRGDAPFHLLRHLSAHPNIMYYFWYHSITSHPNSYKKDSWTSLNYIIYFLQIVLLIITIVPWSLTIR